MYDYFAAPSDEVAATVIDGGPSQFGPVETKWLDPVVVMGKLEELLTGRPYDDVVRDERSGQLVAMEGDGELLVLTVTDGLRDGLHQASDLSDVAVAWAQIEELQRWDPVELAEILHELQALAQKAVSKDERLYCWVCV
ncbi:hypothetical protein SK803_33305 [Lentzea sp. BCCO 10_0856]|uniref:PPM-type phosphatase domain-containing protein n=1 Tax=Lentzea miocenica TaxID=3095431 RepID=A0ABU4TAB6_9PSEU|nr:hypothetical protein [Lentzea sp. BCCO 10_0856]MDX8035116.1 hypothetical protein [Lentzea sp. BCCO 10_0856]